VICL
jgi:hypothetical protein